MTKQGAAPSCLVEVSPIDSGLNATGGTVTVTVSAAAGCSWTATTDDEWMAISPGAGTGSGTIAIDVQANAGVARTGTVAISGRTVTIIQAAASAPPTQPGPPAPQPCTFTVAPLTFTNLGAGSTTLEVAVTAGAGCAWTANSSTSWISISSGASGTANGTVRLAVQQNTGGARSGSVTIAGRTVTISQVAAAPAPCTYAINPTSHTASPAGDSVSVTITTGAGCEWSVSGLPAWISAKPQSGTGPATTTLTVAANPGAARSASVTIAGESFNVTQAAAACSYTIAPTSFTNVSAIGGATTVSVTASGSDCAWTVSGAPAWVTVLPSGGKGSGQVVVTVLPNIGSARSAELQIAGQTFAVSQQALVCTYSVTPTSFEVSSDGGSRSINVTTQSGCPVAAQSSDSWIVISSVPSSGSGTIQFSVSKYNGKNDRTGTITVTGQNFSRTVDVRQEERD